MIIHSGLARHISVLLGYFYPALASAKTAVQQDPAAFTQWMTYWVVMSVFALVEIFVDFFVSWVPFYYEAKIVLIVWLAMPRYQASPTTGASQIYRRLLHPYLDKYEEDIDTGLEEMRAGATRRIQSLGASAATEIAKAVTKQGSTAKDLMLARVLGIAAAGGAESLSERPARSAPTAPIPRPTNDAEGRSRRLARGEEEEEDEEAAEEEESIAAANTSMLLDFIEVMKAGVFVQARSSLAGGNGSFTWCSQKIRLIHGTSWCITRLNDGQEVEVDRGGGGEEQQFQVLAAEAAQDAASDAALLVLTTDRGRVELSPPGRDDRDSMLIGFELLLESFGGVDDGDSGGGGGGFKQAALPDRHIARRRSKRWEGVRAGGEGMVLESADDDSDDDDHHHQQ
ncbi:unnamed protein product [Ectocarpus fasciculatus]